MSCKNTLTRLSVFCFYCSIVASVVVVLSLKVALVQTRNLAALDHSRYTLHFHVWEDKTVQDNRLNITFLRCKS